MKAGKGAIPLFVCLRKAGMVEVKVVEEGEMYGIMGKGIVWGHRGQCKEKKKKKNSKMYTRSPKGFKAHHYANEISGNKLNTLMGQAGTRTH